jgi:ribosomal protein S18 acetylase RimI-like enzyme
VRCIADAAGRSSTTPFDDTGPPIAIRQFEGRDVTSIARIVGDALHEHYDSALYFSLSQAWPEGFLVGVDTADMPIALLLGVVQIPGEARILMFAVDRPYLKHGLGSRLMDEFLGRCRVRGMRRTTLEVRIGNTNAIRFYTRYRFSVTDLLRGYYSDGENGYQMARDLL